MTWCKHKVTGAHDWRWRAIPDNRPLYGLETLTEDTVGFPACITEGEKAAHAARQLMPRFVGLTSSGGSKVADKADWTPLIGRRAVIWPDADKAGADYARTVVRELRKVGVTDVHIINLSAVFGSDIKEGFDAADALARGWTAERLGKALAADDALLPAEEDDEPADGLPTIRIIPGNLDKVIRNAERVLIDSGIPVFDRGGQVVRPVMLMSDVPMDGGTIPAGSLAIMDVSAGWLTIALNRVAAWYTKARDSFRRIDCPAKYAALYLDAAGTWTLPVLTGIVEAPTIRPDGTLLTKPGYDPRLGLYLDYTGLPITVPEYPTKEDALAALDKLKDIYSDFPFVDTAAQTAVLSCVLTAVVRRALRTAPFHGFDAPEKGTGKSLLADTCAIIATGRTATTASLPSSLDECQKRLESYVLRGTPFLNIDNVSRALEGDFLCSLSTSETVDPRLLGVSKTVRVKTNTIVVVFTGNNLTLAGDVTRRALLCRIDAQMEKPDTRTGFKIPDLKRYVSAHRHEFIAAALTIIRAYVVAGAPPHGKERFGDHIDWDSWVRGSLIWLGEADPLETRSRILEVDPVSSNFSTLLEAWYSRLGEVPVTAKELKAATDPPAVDWPDRSGDTTETEEEKTRREDLQDALTEVVGDKDGRINTRSLGAYLRANTDKVTRGLRLERTGEKQHALIYKVRSLDNSKHKKPERPKNNSQNSPNSPAPRGESSELCELSELSELNSGPSGKACNTHPPADPPPPAADDVEVF